MLWLLLGLGVVGMVVVAVAIVVAVVLQKRSSAANPKEDLSDFAPAASVPAVEVPRVETAPVVEAPVGSAAPPDEDALLEAPVAVVLTRVEKLRLPDVSVSVLAHALELDGVELLAFVTEGFATRGRPELVFYGARAAFAEADVVRTLRRFAAMALLLFERAEPVRAGDLLKFAGELGTTPLGGYLALEPNEPAIVPVGEHLVLFGLQRRDLTEAPEALRAALVARHGGVPYVTTLDA